MNAVRRCKSPRSCCCQCLLLHTRFLAYCTLLVPRLTPPPPSTFARREAGAINVSLCMLNGCLKMMSAEKAPPLVAGATPRTTPVKASLHARNDKLTQLFMNIFEGKGRLVMCVHISPEDHHYALTKSALEVRAACVGRGCMSVCAQALQIAALLIFDRSAAIVLAISSA